MAKKTTARGGDGRKTTKDDNGAGSRLRSFLERVERLEEEKKTIADDIKDVFGEAKGEGFDPKAMKRILVERRADRDSLMEFEAILDTYRAALGMLPPDVDEDIQSDNDNDGDGDEEEQSLV